MTGSLHIFHVFSTFCAGGPQVRTCTIMNALGPGFSHTITATDGNFAAAEKIAPGVSWRILPPPPGKRKLWYALPFSKMLREVRPDLLVTYNWGAMDAVLASRIAPVCPVIHAEDGFSADEATRLKLRRVWMRQLALNGVQAVVVPSQTLVKLAISRYGVRSDRVLWIPNGVDTQRFQPSPNQEWRQARGISEKSLLFGYIGRLGTEKNLGMMLRAFARLNRPDTRLALIGEGACRGELEELARTLEIADKVLFTGPIENIAPCYQALDVFLMSSTTEQMSIALLEAMATGLPVISTDVGDSANVLGDPGAPAVVPSGDLEAYANSLRAISADAALRSRLGTANRDRCVREYSLNAMIAEYRRLYEKMAQRH